MVNLDSIKLRISNQYLQDWNKDVFDISTKSRANEKTRILYQLNSFPKPLGLKDITIYEAGYEAGYFTLEVSAKLLRENYFELINKNTFENLLENLNSLDIIKLDLSCIDTIEVFRCDVTNNLILNDEKEIQRFLQSLSIYKFNNKYECRLYESESIVFNKRVTTNHLKEQQTFYYKYPEIKRDKELLEYIDKEACKHMLRCESKFATYKQIRSVFNIQDIKLINVFDSTENVNYNILNRITKDIDSKELPLLKNFSKLLEDKDKMKNKEIVKTNGMIDVLQACNNDIDLIKIYLARNSTANNSRLFKEYKSLLKSFKDCESDNSIQKDIEKIRGYLKAS